MVKKEKIEQWLQKADEDYLFATANLKEGSEFFAQICFHYQQAAEKYLKTYIVAYELGLRKIHDLAKLLNICGNHDNSFLSLEEECNELNQYYIDTRYPAHWPTHHNNELTLCAKEAAHKIADFVKARLPR